MGLNEQLQDVHKSIEYLGEKIEQMEETINILVDSLADFAIRVQALEDTILEETKDAKPSDLGGSDG